jgi:hypothetical protein
MAVDPMELEARVRALARAIDAPEDLVPTFGWSRDGAYPFIEWTGEAMHWVVEERGVELERRTTTDRDELLYWVFESVTLSMASGWAARHRNEAEDHRRAMYRRQLELLGRLRPSWVDRRKAELGPRLDEVGLA